MTPDHRIEIIPLDEKHAIYLRDALLKAIYNPENRAIPAEILQEESLSKYHESWGREGDFGYVAVYEDSGEAVGVCWCRWFKGENRGYGYVDDETPELSIAVWESYRGQGIGGTLLERTIEKARSMGCRGLSLSVQKGNRSVGLYEDKGFKVMRLEDGAYTMYLDLSLG
jgi:ribosomal protein S18 acetylase RimI-like enzyme